MTVIRQCIQDLASCKNVETHEEDIVEDEHDGGGFAGKSVAAGELKGNVDDIPDVYREVKSVWLSLQENAYLHGRGCLMQYCHRV